MYSGSSNSYFSIASDLVYFRKLIGAKAIEELFMEINFICGKDSFQQAICMDTTAQEKNSTFPMDAKLQLKIIIKCNAIAKE